MNNETPQFIVRYWIREVKSRTPPVLRHTVFYNELDMLKELPKIHGNYTVYEVGKQYFGKEYFDKIFAKEQEEKERATFLKLKEKYDSR